MEPQRLPHLVKKSMVLIQTSYFFSILFFSSSLGFLLFHSIKPNFSVLSLFSSDKFNIDRNHMFLLCNGILVILVKSSSLSPNPDDKNTKFDDQQPVIESGCETKPESQKQRIEDDNVSETIVVTEFCDDHDHDHDQDEVFYDDDCDDDEEEGVDAEDLNKRCEDFIRRMKQGIIYESKKDPALVRFS